LFPDLSSHWLTSLPVKCTVDASDASSHNSRLFLGIQSDSLELELYPAELLDVLTPPLDSLLELDDWVLLEVLIPKLDEED